MNLDSKFMLELLSTIKNLKNIESFDEDFDYSIFDIFNSSECGKYFDGDILNDILYCINSKNYENLKEKLIELEPNILVLDKRASLDYHLTKKVSYSETDYSIRYLIDEFANCRMQMPKYQRSYIWDDEQVGEFILSLLRGIPIPKLYGYSEFNDSINKNIKLIIDGQQRLTSILMWYYGIFPKYKIRKINYSEYMTEIVTLSNYYYEKDVYIGVYPGFPTKPVIRNF